MLRRQIDALSPLDPLHKELSKKYAQIKRKKRRQAQFALQQLCHQACHDARLFWRRYWKHSTVLGDIPPQQWHSAFRDLFNAEAGPVSP